MTIRPFYEPRMLEMRLEEYANIAIDGGLWLVGEVLAQRPSMSDDFVPDPRYLYKPRDLDAAIIELRASNEDLRHRIFIAGFLRLPDNGAQATFRRLLVKHAEMLHEALRFEWTRRCDKTIGGRKPSGKLVRVDLYEKLRATTAGKELAIEVKK
ncbi:MAG: hypothetical protein JHD07_22240 [Bradyrhizobium sp.]|jgi:hypothetical protein|uniref:hypothetical protein n=1 Tax=Bradyrhizobium TaxID=374 RepID=UPI0003FD4F7D|nr:MULTISPECIES: hypothetical protein [Bradyrhizobium]MBJ7405880.1 hypothetical protein [Bradyrhizobium sp.]